MSTLESLICPLCGASELDEIGESRFRCKYCGATSVRSTYMKGTLKILEWVCPKCGFDNEKGSAFCGECGEPLKKPCYKCANQMRWDLKRCPKCGFGLDKDEKVVFVYNLNMANETYTTVTNKRILTSWARFFGGDNAFHEHSLDDVLEVIVGKKKKFSGEMQSLSMVWVKIRNIGERTFNFDPVSDAERFAAAIRQGQRSK